MTAKRYHTAIYRLNISYLSSLFGKFQVLGKNCKRAKAVSPQLDLLKGRVLQLLLAHQSHRGLRCYTIAWQTHQSNGLAHLDILLKYETSIKKRSSSFNYLLPLCPQQLELLPDHQPRVFITPYSMSKLNQAVLQYGTKQDPQPLSTFTPQQSNSFLVLAAIKKDPYAYLQRAMKKDPYNFDLAQYCNQYNLTSVIKQWYTIKNKLLDIRKAQIARLQLSKPGIKLITRQLVTQRLTPQQLVVYDSHPCFQTIVDHINQIPTHGPHRPHKTPNLFISGPKDIGKTALFTELSHLVGSYNMTVQNKYINHYSNNKYGFIIWNETKFTDFTHVWILRFLQGIQVSIPMRYNACIKRDNPIVVMTSNLSLAQHISNRYGDSPLLHSTATENLGARITHVHVPVPMFFMQKLLVKASVPQQ